MYQINRRFSFMPMVLFSYLLFVGCDEVDSSGEILCPLSIGNYWAYENIRYMDNKILEGLTDTFKLEITDKVTIEHDGEIYQAAVWTWLSPVTNEPIDTKWFYWNGPDGLYLLGGMSSTDTLITKILRWKYPTRKGDTWEIPQLVHNSQTGKFIFKDPLKYTCISTDDEFETPIGTFTCYVYHTRKKLAEDVLESWDYYSYYVPGIGPIGQVVKGSLVDDIKSRRIIYTYLAD